MIHLPAATIGLSWQFLWMTHFLQTPTIGLSAFVYEMVPLLSVVDDDYGNCVGPTMGI